MYAILNGQMVLKSDLLVSPTDLGLQRGYAAFDFFRTKNFVPLFLPDYLDRFFTSAQAMHLALPFEKPELRQQLETLIEKTGVPDLGVKLLLTGGYSADGFVPLKPNFMAIPEPLAAMPTVLAPAIRLMTHPFQREMPHLKTTNYLTAIWLLPRLQAYGAHDALYHQHGTVAECPRANIFMVNAKGELCTPALQVLHGITRKKVLQLAAKHTTVVERPIALDELLKAEEVFITSTTKRLLPVATIDRCTIGTGKAGPLTTRLFADFVDLENAACKNVSALA
ncbi:MAG: amino acid aminotransferase [Bacteroidetes bacterium]|nr:MAG: amino acid aminotransferase [Bacteroidota bacterium]